ncbi:M20/M25/M40 family metallo-hydrolase [Staphylococcus sp. SQ8-PEA]|uniref:M20/M25/M40 family metallo-hydrolase n=1 Tax=Staphylococcus marylandisciuri TaxID=2981529 RepID=A0ABT2QQT5_9STAP|nr:M20/M25/M40 family metallo-hydrolase [Staphylococcus marylandisciuri]MCU5746312.1 M20/M25/M40 family metallo-hydrolase [Staphylococcus marylandisciuri]
MEHLYWQTPEQREDLLKALVNFNTVTHSEGEKAFPEFLINQLTQLTYFKTNSNHIHLVDTEDNKQAVVAYYQAPNTKRTVTLISHFDTVDTDDYSDYEPYATQMDLLTRKFNEDSSFLDENAIADLKSGDYLFGRGSMDMKPGLMLHMSLLEKAISELWNVNLVLIAVPDEEVNSSGMRAAMSFLKKLKDREDLDIRLHLNSEPTFQQETGDNSHYTYTGSIGKIMPSVLVYGRETHVGTPLNGVSSNFIQSYINQQVEYSTAFQETFESEVSPLPVSLVMRDIKHHYDVQTPFKTLTLYNVFLFKHTPAEVFEKFNTLVRKGVNQAKAAYEERSQTAGSHRRIDIPVITYDSLYYKAIELLGSARVEEEIDQILEREQDILQQSVKIVDRLLSLCRSLTPTVVTFFAPPYYPAVNNSYEDFVERLVTKVSTTAQSQFGRPSRRIHYFNGICDLSYVRLTHALGDMEVYRHNTPNFERSYTIPFQDIYEISAPAFNCGPIGKDAHRVSERIYKKSAFEELPVLVEAVVREVEAQ